MSALDRATARAEDFKTVMTGDDEKGYRISITAPARFSELDLLEGYVDLAATCIDLHRRITELESRL